ncbi:spore coat protein [Clostridium kluyveri]|uniref:Spore coat protein n=1 Tax=Clostridium kluyveri TaxID=1534 RepID=A0A1L5FDZ7_CLOKL|nr:spore coat protein [Clostridium kluyveri]APM41040.1 spore coat protein [Clostridium kluyveri]UZQ48681.1 spore coat protein [Clostridium kluyveri]
MYSDNVELCFIEYLKSKGIYVVKQFNRDLKQESLTLNRIKEQISIISEFHKRTLGYTGVMNKRLDNNIGRVVERYKIYIRKLKKYLEQISSYKNRSNFEEKLNKVGEGYLIRAERCMENLYKNNYIDLILRSMSRVEMCLTDIYFDNLRKTKDIQVINIKNCCYNMVEMDLVYFLNKIKRKGIDINFSELIKSFCIEESLDDNSLQFILSIISYPYQFMKCCNKYRYNTKNWTEDEYLLRLDKSINEDGESLI